MSILKDAASTAIYGSQGANGVIVVTTKKGKIGKATINASVKMGVNQLHRGNMNMMNGEELYDYYKSFANQDALPSYFTEDLRNRNFDWWKEGTHLASLKITMFLFPEVPRRSRLILPLVTTMRMVP